MPIETMLTSSQRTGTPHLGARQGLKTASFTSQPSDLGNLLHFSEVSSSIKWEPSPLHLVVAEVKYNNEVISKMVSQIHHVAVRGEE